MVNDDRPNSGEQGEEQGEVQRPSDGGQAPTEEDGGTSQPAPGDDIIIK
jgi:hypothetical protein